MSRIEHRLRDAFGAAAEIVRPESVAALRDPSRETRPSRVAALAAAAAAAVVIVGASVITPLALAGGHGAPSRPAAPPVTSPAAPASPPNRSSPSSSPSAEVTTVPDVIGMTVNQALLVLQAARLSVAVISSQDSGAVPPATVIAQSPVAGTRLISGATITLTIAGPGSSPTPAPGAAR